MFKCLSYGIALIMLMNFAVSAKDYNGAELFSNSSVKYGRFDARMRVVSAQGVISSFFLYYNDSYLSGEPWEEIDMEIVGKHENAFQSNLITGTAASKNTSEKLHDFNGLSESYHTYSFEWTPDYIAWFFDGVEVRRSTGAQVTDCQIEDMSIRCNLWISDAVSWAGSFDPSQLPLYQYINWVSYSRYTPGSGTDGSDFTPDWRDDFDTFDAARWGKGNWTFENNLVDFTTGNIVVKDGYCILCLTTTAVPGFSGNVPGDVATSILNRKPAETIAIFNNEYAKQRTSFSVTLDGRMLPRKGKRIPGNNPAVWITKENNSIMRTISF